ncbi:MAG: class I SAM-dependent methyltransferase [Candidatus Hydrogenedentes bacterium]|nr:class I SAM-dependent methyltransferase [Candidatus Hydrogenedentota bacterium]
MSRFGGYEDLPFLAELYDRLPAYAARKDVDFYVSCALAAEGPTLELACGTGRVLLPIAEAGCRIAGLDLSEYMLAKCREKLEHASADVQERVRIVHGDMTQFDLGESFALVTTPFRSFQHLVSVEDQLACLLCANHHLSVGGTLILDLFHPNLRYLCDPRADEEKEDCAGVALPGGRTLRQTHRLVAHHRAQQCIDVEMIFYVGHSDGCEERLVHAFPLRYFFRYEVEHLLQRCGFDVIELLGNHDRSPFSDDSPEMIVVAKKTAHWHA